MKPTLPGLIPVYAATTFLSAFLLFQVQPILAGFLLPWFGGGAGVWTACMLFFQVLLLGGYAYAHLLGRVPVPQRQAIIHLVIVALTLLTLPILLDPASKPTGSEMPTASILVLLAITAGGPYFMLAASSPLLASWYRRSHPDGAPYRLYALSNAGSLLALLSYPFVFESSFSLREQGIGWSWAYTVFGIATAACAWLLVRQMNVTSSVPTPPSPETVNPGEPHDASPRWPSVLAWIALSATGSVMLLATTSQISQELSVMPMLWILPLSIYLLTFILCFERDAWYDRRVFVPLLAISVCAVLYLMISEVAVDIRTQIGIYLAALFVFCMSCHGELVRLRPPANRLTGFYLAVALGGALGGFLTAVVAPLIFSGYWEYDMALAAMVLAVLLAVLRDLKRNPKRPPHLARHLALAGTLGVLVMTGLIAGLTMHIANWEHEAIATNRNFFGVLRVKPVPSIAGEMYRMLHGKTSHGVQFQATNLRQIATSYYGRHSGVGLAIGAYRDLRKDAATFESSNGRGVESGLHIGSIGLGVGTVAALAERGDLVRFYEINPQVEHLARKHFSYLSDTPADVEVVIGDARIQLERELEKDGSQKFDVLVVDAFNSDSVPRHLLTVEAYALYRRHLRPGGVIAFHTSNHNLGLSSIVHSIAQHNGDEAVRIQSVEEEWLGTTSARWVITTRNADLLTLERLRVEATPWASEEIGAQAWTDDQASLWEAMKYRRTRQPNRWRQALNKGRFVVDTAHLLTPADAEAIHQRSRALYLDSSGRFPIMILTVGSDADGAGEIGFEELVSHLADRVGFNRSKPHQGVMILVSLPHGRVGARIGKNWTRESKQHLMGALSPLSSDLERTKLSGVLASTVEALNRIAREQADFPSRNLTGTYPTARGCQPNEVACGSKEIDLLPAL